jgi:hypothetical protein
MTVLTESSPSRGSSRRARRLGPVTSARQRRAAFAYVALCAIGLLPALLDLAPALEAAGLGLWFPGAGFIASGGWSLLLLPLTAVLFCFALVAWFGAGMVIAPVFVWAGAAVLAGLTAGSATWAPAPFVVPALVVGGGVLLRRRGERTRLRERALRAERETYVEGAVARAVERAERAPLGDRELSAAELASVRYVLDRALQPIGQLNGFDRVDQFQTSALRYQINHAGYALGELQCAYTPSFHGYLSQAQRNLIEQYVQRPIWSYWVYETAWGHLNFRNFDPVARDNVMLTGWFGIQLSLYMSSTGDRRYAEAGSLPFRLNERTCFPHNVHTLARSVFENFKASAFCLYPCEPNWVYPICNHYGMTSLVLYDRLFGTSLVPEIRDRWLASLDTEFTDESGAVIGLRSSLTGLRFPFPGGHLPFAPFMHCIDPERAWEMWAIARHDLERTLKKDESGEERLALPGRGFDFGNYRRGWGGTYAAIQAVAREFGDDGIARAAQRSLDRDGGRVEDRGVTHYERMSNLSNLSAVLGQIRRRGYFRRAVTEGPPDSVFRGPLLCDAKYPDVLVARAFSHGDDLELVLHPGAERGTHTIGVERLRPNAKYRTRGAQELAFAADARGTASLDVDLHGRTPLHIVPAP